MPFGHPPAQFRCGRPAAGPRGGARRARPRCARQRSRAPALVLIVGEGGIGKTTLLGRLADRAAAAGPPARPGQPAAGRGRRARTPDIALWGHVWRIDAALQLGAMHEVELTELETLLERLGWPLARWHLLPTRATRALIAGEYSRSAQLTTDARSVARLTQDASVHAQAFAFLVDLEQRTGRFSDLEPELGELVDGLMFPLAWAGYGNFRLAQGDRDTAARQLARLRPVLPSRPLDTR